LEYGNVQRAILGVEGGELNATASKALGINQTEGLCWCSDKNSGAENLDLKRRYYRKMDGQRLLLMRTCLDINTKRPNDKIQVTYTRNGKNNVVPVVLSKMNSQVLNLKESN
jgi:S1-C subfamily serine protease